MDDSVNPHDWELILSSDSSADPKAFEVLDKGIGDGSIKSDHFTFESAGRSSPSSEEESDEGGVDSDNPSGVDPDSDSVLHDTARGQSGFVGMTFPVRNSGAFSSDESSDGQRSLSDGKMMELRNVGDSVVEDEISASPEIMAVCGGGGGSVSENEKREKVWWKVPLRLLKFCIFSVRPIWPISIAAAVVGIVMLKRNLHRKKDKSRNIALRINIADKKDSQFPARAIYLNEAISAVRRIPIIWPSLTVSGNNQRASLHLRSQRYSG